MSRRHAAEKREVLPDPKFKDLVITKFMNSLMKDGKKSAAERIVYGALDIIQSKGTGDPVSVFHEAIDKLPEREREVTELIWYHGMSQQDAAEALEVDERTVRRRWRSARLALSQLLVGVMPAM